MTKEELENYLFTLEICKKNLPSDAHSIHFDRLDEIKKMLKSKYEKSQKELYNKERAKKHIEFIKNISPENLLKEYQGGGEVNKSDLNLIETLRNEYKLSNQVINVLLEYLLISNDKKIPSYLAKKVAKKLQDSNITTVEETMAELRKNKVKY